MILPGLLSRAVESAPAMAGNRGIANVALSMAGSTEPPGPAKRDEALHESADAEDTASSALPFWPPSLAAQARLSRTGFNARRSPVPR